MSPPMPGRRSVRQVVAPIAALVGLAGLVGIVGGTFLPWVRSGLVQRNLYAVAGVADRLGVLGPGHGLSTWLPLIGPACMVPVVLAALRLRRTAALASLAIAVASGGAAGLLLAVATGREAMGVSLAVAGPAAVLVGALLLAAGAIGTLGARAPRHRAGTPVPAPPVELPQHGPSTAFDGHTDS